MSDNNFMKIAVGLGALFLAVKFLKKDDLKEGFFGQPFPMTYKVNSVSQNRATGDFYEVPGLFQAQLSPRFDNSQLGAYIQYNMPNVNQLGSDPTDPLSMKNMAYRSPNTPTIITEKYQGALMDVPQAGQAQMHSSAQHFGGQNLKYSEAVNELPVQPMGALVNANGENMQQPIIYDRFMYANARSRNFGNGDPIRGDLPIAPNNSGWFQVSVHPNIDLRDGALAVMAGANNDTTKEMLALRTASAGGLLNQTGSGISYSVNQSPFGANANSTLGVSAFP